MRQNHINERSNCNMRILTQALRLPSTFTRLFLVVILLTACSVPNIEQEDELNSMNYKDIDETYSIDDAIKDNCVVSDNGKIVTDDDMWAGFLKEVAMGNSSSIRIFYFQAGNDVPRYIDLNYDGIDFTVYENSSSQETFEFLNHFSNGETLAGTYVLATENLTRSEFEKIMTSSHVELVDNNTNVFRYKFVFVNYY